MGRILGILLIIGGFLVGIIITALMFTYRSEGRLSAGAMVLGLALGFIVLVLPQWGIGAFFLWKGQKDVKIEAQQQQQRKLLNIVQTQGQIPISDLAIELGVSRNEVQDMLYQLVGMGIFTGYVNWDEGMLYSQQAKELRAMTKCQVCGGELELGGHGIIRCPYCGTEYFLD
ncbi:MAG TPA: Lrp/AsnC family transcriptional regulator [Anaerolineae bacterium]|nr:Lrp/AsnC family transcriptional regulator [Anaerolineae bacterium]